MLQPRLATNRWLQLSAVGAFGFLAVWTTAALSGLTSRDFLPTPWDVLQRFVQLAQVVTARLNCRQLLQDFLHLFHFVTLVCQRGRRGVIFLVFLGQIPQRFLKIVAFEQLAVEQV